MDVRRLRDFAASQGLPLSSLIEATVLSALPRLMAEAALARDLERETGFESGGSGVSEYGEVESTRREAGRGGSSLFLDAAGAPGR